MSKLFRFTGTRFLCARRFTRILLCLSLLGASAAPVLAIADGLDLEFGGSGAEAGKFADLRDMAFDGKNTLLTVEGSQETGAATRNTRATCAFSASMPPANR